jgi:hypothetical protein
MSRREAKEAGGIGGNIDTLKDIYTYKYTNIYIERERDGKGHKVRGYNIYIQVYYDI